MKVYLYIDENNYVNGWSSIRSSDKDIEIELEENHEFFSSDFSCWKYENGELFFDEEKQKQLIEEYEREKNKPSELDMLALAVMELGQLIMNGGK